MTDVLHSDVREKTFQYRQQEVMGASPMGLVRLGYDLAIRACEECDFDIANKVVTQLRDALDFEQGEIALRLFALYQWCLDNIRAGDFAAAGDTLKELRQAWIAIEHTAGPSQGSAPPEKGSLLLGSA